MEIYERYYQSQKERKSIQAAYLETPEDEAFLRALGTMSLTRDHNAPRELSKEQIEAVERDPELVQQCERQRRLTKQMERKYGSVPKAKVLA